VNRLLQHLRRRAFVVLAWLVLAVAVPAPAVASIDAPFAALIAPRAGQASAPVAAAPRREASVRSAREVAEQRPAPSAPRAGRCPGALRDAKRQAPARDGRHLYLETLTLLC